MWKQMLPTSDWNTRGPYLSVLSSNMEKSVSRMSWRNWRNCKVLIFHITALLTLIFSSLHKVLTLTISSPLTCLNRPRMSITRSGWAFHFSRANKSTEENENVLQHDKGNTTRRFRPRAYFCEVFGSYRSAWAWLKRAEWRSTGFPWCYAGRWGWRECWGSRYSRPYSRVSPDRERGCWRLCSHHTEKIVHHCFSFISQTQWSIYQTFKQTFIFLIFNQLTCCTKKHLFWIPCARGFIDLSGNVLWIDFMHSAA